MRTGVLFAIDFPMLASSGLLFLLELPCLPASWIYFNYQRHVVSDGFMLALAIFGMYFTWYGDNIGSQYDALMHYPMKR